MNTNETTWKELKDEYPTVGDEWQANDGAWHPVVEPKTSTARQFHPIKFRRPIAPTPAPATSEGTVPNGWVLCCAEGIDPTYCASLEDVRKATKEAIFGSLTEPLSEQEESEVEGAVKILLRDKILRFEGDPPLELLPVKRLPESAEIIAATRRAEEAERERDEALKRCAQATKFRKNS